VLRSLLGLVAASTIAVSLLAAPDARANGRFPAANQIVVAPNDPNTIVLRTTFGVIISRDHGTSWDWICERAIGIKSPTEDPSLGITANNTVIAGTFEGLAVSPDTGCSWSFAANGLENKIVVDTVVRIDAPHVALGLTNKYRAVDDAGNPNYTSQVFSSIDDGASWSAFGTAIDPTAVLETLEVAASDPHRLYVSGYRGAGANVKGILFVSTDDGMTWAERAIPLDPATETSPFIAGVDPTNADRVYVRTNGPNSSRLLVTSDAGMSFTPIFTGASLAGFALSPDGAKVYVGGPKDGLNVASSSDFQFKRTSTVAVQCLKRAGTTLYACSNEVSGFIVGASEDDGATFVAELHLATIRGPLACGASTSSAVCVDDWPAVRDSLGIPADDAGTSDAGTPAGSTPKGCGCRGAPVSGGGVATLCAIVAALAFAARARRARERRR
jgi:photosystem II stability/assembly factor-like uncharacterized protein